MMRTRLLLTGGLLIVVVGTVSIRPVGQFVNALKQGNIRRTSMQRSPNDMTAMPPDAQGRRPNRLIREKSPYLLQHAYNPVDWYPWGEEAFARAKQEDKPVFLSIGYSTCYWCHVMERESFEDSEIAKMLNASFVSIKVDREERPDLDALYMTAVQALSGQGGWPMTVLLTPEGKPFWGGTYFPPEDRWGKPGLRRVLSSISEAWRTRREELLRSSQELTQVLQASAGPNQTAQLTLATLDTASQQLAQQFDATDGGFGQAPKFPRPHALSLLLRMWFRERDPKLLEMVDTTLEAMARGGIHDQLGGGFHRYSTDAQWLVPHFEKMLYDQALIARTYLEAYQVTGKPHYAEVARDIFEYVLRDLRDRTTIGVAKEVPRAAGHAADQAPQGRGSAARGQTRAADPQGAFYAAEDAGEVGQEGDFYVWTWEEVAKALGEKEARVFGQLYDVTPEGNFSAEGDRAVAGGERKNILHIARPLEDLAKSERLDVEVLRARMVAARDKLLAVRTQRRRPHLDDKVLTDWNGLMIGALAYGARVLNEPRYAQAAREAAEFLLAHLQQNGRLLHRYRDGEAKIPAFLDDYAFLSWGLLDLYESTYEAKWLAEAKRLSTEMMRLFWDDQHGGFFLSGELNERLIAKTKELYDGAVPSGNSVAALDLARLAALTMDQAFEQHIERFFQTFADQISQAPHAFPQGLIALDRRLGPSQEIVIAGDLTHPETQAMLQAVHGRFLPRAVMAFHPTAEEPATAIERLIPFIKEQQPLQDKTTVYVCQNYVCTLPTTDLNKLTTLLDALR